jgi:hypothetical protein
MFPLKKKINFTLPFKNVLIKHELVLLLKKVWQKIVITWMISCNDQPISINIIYLIFLHANQNLMIKATVYVV